MSILSHASINRVLPGAFFAIALVLAAATAASAAPVIYGLTGGQITVQAHQTSDQSLVFNETLALSTDSFITWDSVGVPASGTGGTLDDILLTVDPGQGPFATLIDYGPFNMVTIETATISPDTVAGYTTLLTFPNGPGSFLFQAGEVDIDASYSASHDTTGASTPTPQAADITGTNNVNGTVTFAAGVIQVTMDSVIMGTLDGTPFGEAGNDLVITANVNFFGDSNVVPTPEPSTALLIGLGLAALSRRTGRA